MDTKSDLAIKKNSAAGNVISWIFGFLALAIGIINSFWGNDPGYGIFIIFLSLVFFPPITDLIKRVTGISIPVVLRIILALFIIWTAIGVGELFDKIDLMLKDLN